MKKIELLIVLISYIIMATSPIFSIERTGPDNVVNYIQITASSSLFKMFNQSPNQKFLDANLLSYHIISNGPLISIQFKPFYSSSSSSSIINKTYLSATFGAYDLTGNSDTHVFIKFDYGIEHFLTYYLGLGTQIGCNYNWNHIRIQDLPNDRMHYYDNNGFAGSIGGKIVFLADFFGLEQNKRKVIAAFEFESNLFSPNLFSFSKNSASKLVSEDVVPVNNIDYDFPYGYSISINVGVRF